MCELDGDHSRDQQQNHDFLDMMVQEVANDLLQDDFSFSNADVPLASFDERLAVAAGQENGNLVAVQEELLMEDTGDLLLAGAKAVEAGDAMQPSAIMSRLDDLLADVAGEGSCDAAAAASPVDHLACYFARGLQLRISSGAVTPAPAPAPAANRLPAYQMLQELTPFIKFAHFTANQAILEATADDSVVHVVDFNVGEGVQWSSLMADLAGGHRSSKPLFHLTVITSGAGTPSTTARRWLSEFAESLDLPFRYSSLHVHNDDDGDERDDYDMHELARICKGSSSVILSCDTTNTPYTPLHRLQLLLLGTINILHPKLVILIEDELFRISKKPPSLTVAPPFSEFFSEALLHFSALMESMASCFRSYEACLRLVEKEILGPRVEDYVGQYGSLAGGASAAAAGCQLEGLRACEMSSFSIAQAKMLVGLFSRGFGVVHHEKGRLALCWKSRPLTSVSIWCP
ncbi:hypothetical protein E2562_022487 [Oryza meyeriana var. granulata]|uniref:Uncharacterized protein n=1 Tax=Oryza meyeriana var. granulata TaxID=110450 RepID=A0A6G1BMX1_9ORYZ|nr:hypothetical protein E2562_022487 [Oryza meyeriana var. granulata]